MKTFTCFLPPKDTKLVLVKDLDLSKQPCNVIYTNPSSGVFCTQSLGLYGHVFNNKLLVGPMVQRLKTANKAGYVEFEKAKEEARKDKDSFVDVIIPAGTVFEVSSYKLRSMDAPGLKLVFKVPSMKLSLQMPLEEMINIEFTLAEVDEKGKVTRGKSDIVI